MEIVALLISYPLTMMFPLTFAERLLLVFCVFVVLIVELINSAVESTVDLVSTEYSELAKNAKDYGSAAVMLTVLGALSVWIYTIYKSLN